MNLRETYNKIAEEWHKDHQSDDWWIDGTNAFASFLRPGSHILDAGCGSGFKSKYLIKQGFKVTGIDFSENLIDIARREMPNGQFFVLDMRDISQLTDQFDAIFAQASLLHISKKEIVDVLKGLLSKLKKGGYFYIAVKEINPGQQEESVLKEDDYGYEYERFFSYYSMDELKQYFKTLDMEIVYKNIRPTGKTNWIQIIGKKV